MKYKITESFMVNMKKLIVALGLLLLILSPVMALEVGGDFRIGNLALDSIADTTYTGPFDGMDFNSWGLSFYGSHYLSETLRIDTGYYSDNILKNAYYTLFSYSENILQLGVGPFFGLFNADLNTLLKSGISTSIKLELPGILFLDFRTDSSLASRLVIDGDYIQERTDVSFGFYVPNAICSVNLFSKKFTQKSGDTEVIDMLSEYSFKTHLYQKMVPYRATIDFAYQVLSKQFVSATTTKYTLNSLIVGTRLDLDVSDSVTFFLDLENSVYTFGDDELLGVNNPGPGGYAFRASTGVKVNIDTILQKQKMMEEFEEIATNSASERGEG